MVTQEELEQKTANIILVKDHTSFRQALAFMFDREPEFDVIVQASSIEEARKLTNGEYEIDVAVLDLGLPDGGGVSLVKEFSTSKLGISMLVLSASIEPSRFASAVEAGASNMLHKSASMSEIVDSARRLMAGEVLISPS